MPPVPGPVLEAMREWLRPRLRREYGLLTAAEIGGIVAAYDAERLRCAIERRYPGGVSAFLRDHGNKGGETA